MAFGFRRCVFCDVGVLCVWGGGLCRFGVYLPNVLLYARSHYSSRLFAASSLFAFLDNYINTWNRFIKCIESFGRFLDFKTPSTPIPRTFFDDFLGKGV